MRQTYTWTEMRRTKQYILTESGDTPVSKQDVGRREPLISFLLFYPKDVDMASNLHCEVSERDFTKGHSRRTNKGEEDDLLFLFSAFCSVFCTDVRHGSLTSVVVRYRRRLINLTSMCYVQRITLHHKARLAD